LNKIFVKLKEIAVSEKGKKPKTLIDKKKDGYIPYMDIEAFEKDTYKKYTDGVKCNFCEPGDVAIVWDGSRSGLVGRAKNKGAIGSTIAKINIPIINKDYLYYFLKGKYLILNTNTKGTGTPHVNPTVLWNFNFPIAPLNEQNRIVEKIEELFSGLGKATEELQKVREQLKVYRQSVLKAAFEGKFTEEWRQKNKKVKEVKSIPLENICIKAKKIKQDENPEKKIKYIDIGSIDNKNLKIVSYKKYKLKDAPSRAKQIIKKGDILFSTVRTYLKNIAYVNLEYDNEICSTGFCVIRPKQNILSSKYLFYNVTSENFINKITPLQTGTSYPAVRDNDIFKQSITFFNIEEQEEIVQEIESRLSVCDKIEESVESGLKKIEHLRQSILKRAFEGELVSQDPKDPPAEELLEQIKIEKEKTKNNSKKKVKA